MYPCGKGPVEDVFKKENFEVGRGNLLSITFNRFGLELFKKEMLF